MRAVPPADDGLAGELTTLRRRTYGPDADTDTDPIAQARLADLGERFHRMSAWGRLAGGHAGKCLDVHRANRCLPVEPNFPTENTIHA